MKIIIGKLKFETYEGCTGKRIFNINILNEFGGSIGYADPNLFKVIYWWIKK